MMTISNFFQDPRNGAKLRSFVPVGAGSIHRATAILAVLLLTACARLRFSESSVALETTPDPVTRLISADPATVLQAGAAALRGMGFDIAPPPNEDINWIYSNPIVIQSTWRGQAVSERILCGLGTAISSDPVRVTQVANTIPIELSLGFEVEVVPGATATRILFGAQGRRVGYSFLTSPTMSCTLTYGFVDEIFNALRAELRKISS